jgi:hypothetical protein
LTYPMWLSEAVSIYSSVLHDSAEEISPTAANFRKTVEDVLAYAH